MSSVNSIETSLNVFLAGCGLEAELVFIPVEQRADVTSGDGANHRSISVSHYPVLMERKWQGDNVPGGVGQRYYGMMDLSVWVSRAANSSWMRELRELSSALVTCLAGAKAVKLHDYDRDPPVMFDDMAESERGKIYLGDLRPGQAMQDGNPDIERRRFLQDYFSVVRG